MDGAVAPSCSDIDMLFNKLEEQEGDSHDDVMKKLQAIRLWQLMQQEELKKQQQSQLAMLKGQAGRQLDSEDPSVVASDNEQSDENDEVDTDAGDEVLAFPLDSLKQRLETIVEQPSVVDISSEHNDLAEEIVSVSDDEEQAESTDGTASPSDVHLPEETDEEPTHDEVLVEEDIEASLEESLTKGICFDEVPVKGGGNKKSFEQLLEEQLKGNEPGTNSKKKSASTPKRTFLRRGDGIARFKGPPVRPKKKVPPVATEGQAIKPQQDMVGKSAGENVFFETEPKSPHVVEKIVEQKPRIRKTARKKEPIKELKLKPIRPKPHVHFGNPVCSVPEYGSDDVDQEDDLDDTLQETQEQLQESVWSDVEDSVLTINTTGIENMGPIDFDKTSNETFEQMEKFCNQRYGSVESPEEKLRSKPVSPPQPSKLMQSLFPSLKAKKQDLKKKDQAAEVLSPPTSQVQKPPSQVASCVNNVCTSQEQPTILKSKLEEMEGEIKKFQDETMKLSTVRLQEEEQLRLLKNEFEEFQKQKEEELQRLDEFKKSETKKLKKERKLFEEHVTAVKSLPNKKDREYIRELEKNICELQDEYKTKEQRLIAANNRLRTQLENANKDNENLKEKLKAAEEKLEKFEKEKELKKSKKSGAVWKAINNIVDATTIDENEPSMDLITRQAPPGKCDVQKPVKQKKREPLVDRNDNHLYVSQDIEENTERGKTERKLQDGSFEVSYSNGTKKVISANGDNTKVLFANGDVKTIEVDGSVSYTYKSSGTKHTTHPNGMQVIEFSNKQVERHFPDGSKHISFADGSSKMMKLDGTEETIFPDGTVMIVKPNGHKTIEFSNGQREIHTPEYKRREYPEGTHKTVYSDGRQETMYASGRLRIKDANGVLIVDKMLDKPISPPET